MSIYSYILEVTTKPNKPMRAMRAGVSASFETTPSAFLFKMRRISRRETLLTALLLSIILICLGTHFAEFDRVLIDSRQEADRIIDAKISVEVARQYYNDFLTLPDIDKLSERYAQSRSPPTLKQPNGNKLIILVPYRDRKRDLLTFLLHMTAYMRIKAIPYEIVVAEQDSNGRFNRAKLFNAALKEIFNAKLGDRLYGSYCFAFHDVDKIPISLKTPYQCLFRPVQLLRYVHYKKGGKKMYQYSLGGITLFSRAHLEAMNGASNSFKGWGGEDDDLKKRVLYIHQRPLFVRFDEGQFYEEDGDTHPRDKNEDRYKVLARSSPQSMREDGFQQVQYTLIRRIDFENFVWMHFSI
ncbi:hypothetical protein Aperf_G00000114130 [Anoplocephala perfoliata]